MKIEIIYINKYYTKWKLYLLPKKYKTQLENANNNIYNTNEFKIFKIIYGIKKIEDREYEKIGIPDDSKTN